MYVSSNDNNSDSTKDGSLQTNISYMWLSEWLVYTIQKLQNRINELSKLDESWRDYIPIVTASWSMTISNLVIWCARYKLIWKSLFLNVNITFTLWWTADKYIIISKPTKSKIRDIWGGAYVWDWTGVGGVFLTASWNSDQPFYVFRYDNANWSLWPWRSISFTTVLEIE